MKNFRTLTLMAIVLIAALSRVVPHPWNATPVMAIALFSGAHLRNKWFAAFLPLFAMFVSDIFIGFYPTWPVTYICIAFVALLGWRLQNNKSITRVAFASLAGSMVFFLVTNFVCWLTMPEYSKDMSGFFLCYVRAVPFFRNALLGDMIFTAILFGSFSFGEKKFPVLRQTPQPT
ncbi:MAG: hypothetical protein KCHDKBKB_01951 [Elusimicrobia bacterium]|nr:hypothetical protein [Elusimicrobiota bacterium]